MSASYHIRDQVEPIADQAMCAVLESGSFQSHREALGAQQDFEPFRLAEAGA
jgi:hypothetical protein